ncbi:MAG: acyl-CoA dehydrogenase domain-containing protein, partial [Pseudomonadota bacterium]
LFILPFGIMRRGPSDRTRRACARLLLEPSAARDRLTEDVYLGAGEDAVAQLERALAEVVATDPIRDRLKKLRVRDPQAAWDQGLISRADYEALRSAEAAVQAVVAVDDFAPAELTGARSEQPARHAEAAE